MARVPPEIATLFAPTFGVTRMPLVAIVLVPERVTAAAAGAWNRRLFVDELSGGAELPVTVVSFPATQASFT
jgi:hypothetical protein